ncbi:MAG: hypothetical protein VR69_14835 [Peptococcaceae bacterium BRH_c4b]|nr:MAG: hypothetical protein VR69_14835 [Peptococcaceae bacterium BRH_c4b]
MEPRLQLFLIIISFVFAGFIFSLVKKETLELRYTLIWIVTGIILVLIALQPQIVTIVANILGVGLPVNALFLVGILFALIILFTMTIALSKASVRIKRLAQELAILKLDLSKYKDESC